MIPYWRVILAVAVVALLAISYYKSDIDPRDAAHEVKEKALYAFFTPKYLFLGVILALCYEMLTQNISDIFYGFSTEIQVFLITFLAVVLATDKLQEWLLNLTYTPNWDYLLVLNPEWGGDFDLLRGGAEKFRNFTIRGADDIHEKKTPAGTPVKEVREYDRETDTVTATWKALKSPLEVEKTANAIAFNTRMLREKIDEARDIKKSAIGLKQELYDMIFEEVRAEVEDKETTSETTTDDAMKEVLESYDPENIEDTIESELADDDGDESDDTGESIQGDNAEVDAAENGGDADE